jgi:hypothetical protein
MQRLLGNRRKGARAGNRFLRVHHDAMLNPCALRLHGAPQRAKIEGRFHAERDKAARPQNLQRAHHLGGGQTQIQRSDDHADLETTVFQQNVIHGKRQQRDQVIALHEAQARQLLRQRRGRAVELAPGDGAVAVRAQEGKRLRFGLRPLRHYVVQ